MPCKVADIKAEIETLFRRGAKEHKVVQVLVKLGEDKGFMRKLCRESMPGGE